MVWYGMAQRRYQALLKTMIQLKRASFLVCNSARVCLKGKVVKRVGDEEVGLGLWLDASQRDASGAYEA